MSETKKWIKLANKFNAEGMTPEKVDGMWTEFMRFVRDVKKLGYNDLRAVRRALEKPPEDGSTEIKQLVKALTDHINVSTESLKQLLHDTYQPEEEELNYDKVQQTVLQHGK